MPGVAVVQGAVQQALHSRKRARDLGNTAKVKSEAVVRARLMKAARQAPFETTKAERRELSAEELAEERRKLEMAAAKQHERVRRKRLLRQEEEDRVRLEAAARAMAAQHPARTACPRPRSACL